MNLKIFLLPFFFAGAFISPMGWSYADEDLQDPLAYCHALDILEAQSKEYDLPHDINIVNPEIKKHCQSLREAVCPQEIEEQKKKMQDILDDLSITAPKSSVVWLWNKFNKAGNPLNFLMRYYVIQYDILNGILDELTEACSDMKIEFIQIKEMLTADYAECRSKAAEGKSNINCLSKFHDGLMSTATILQLVLHGETFEEIFNQVQAILVDSLEDEDLKIEGELSETEEIKEACHDAETTDGLLENQFQQSLEDGNVKIENDLAETEGIEVSQGLDEIQEGLQP